MTLDIVSRAVNTFFPDCGNPCYFPNVPRPRSRPQTPETPFAQWLGAELDRRKSNRNKLAVAKSPDMPAKTQLSGRFIYGIPDGCSPAILTAVPVLQIGGKPLPQTWTIP